MLAYDLFHLLCRASVDYELEYHWEWIPSAYEMRPTDYPADERWAWEIATDTDAILQRVCNALHPTLEDLAEAHEYYSDVALDLEQEGIEIWWLIEEEGYPSNHPDIRRAFETLEERTEKNAGRLSHIETLVKIRCRRRVMHHPSLGYEMGFRAADQCIPK